MTVTTRSPTTVISNTGWTAPQNTYVSDTLRATVSTTGTTNFIVGGFGLAPLIGTDTVNSVTIRVQHFENQTNQNRFYVDLLDNGAVLAGGQQIATRTTEGYDQIVLTGITAAQINSLQLRIEGAKQGGGGSRTFNVNHLEISVDHTPVVQNPKLSTVVANLDSAPETPWITFGNAAIFESGAARFDLTVAGAYHGYQHPSNIDATLSSLTTRIGRSWSVPSGESLAGFRSSITNDNRILLGWKTTALVGQIWTNGVREYEVLPASSDDPETTALRISTTATEVVFEKKPQGGVWTEFGRAPLPSWDLSTVWPTMSFGFWDTADVVSGTNSARIHGYNADTEVVQSPFPWKGLSGGRPWRGLGVDTFKGSTNTNLVTSDVQSTV